MANRLTFLTLRGLKMETFFCEVVGAPVIGVIPMVPGDVIQRPVYAVRSNLNALNPSDPSNVSISVYDDINGLQTLAFVMSEGLAAQSTLQSNCKSVTQLLALLIGRDVIITYQNP